MNIQLIELQNQVVLCVANSVSMNWEHLLVDFEREVIGNELVEDCLAVAFTRENNTWQRQSFQLGSQCYDLFGPLCEAVSKDGNGQWGSCTLEVDSSGRYRFSFSYEPPKRLNGDFSDAALRNDYLPRML
jgi:hypothetical protein